MLRRWRFDAEGWAGKESCDAFNGTCGYMARRPVCRYWWDADQELTNHSVRALTSDGHGGALAIVDGRSLCRRSLSGVWSTIATEELNLACCVTVGDLVYVGTDDARILRVSAAGEIEQLRGFDRVAGRDKWYAGTALINGRIVGPPLGYVP